MEATLNRNELRRLSSALTGILPRRHKDMLPALSHVLIDTRSGAIEVTSSDLDTWATVRLEGEVVEAGAVTVDLHSLAAIARLLPAGQVTLTRFVRNDTPALRLVQVDIRFELEGGFEDDFPGAPEFDVSHEMLLPAGELFPAFDAVSFAVSTEEHRPILNGVQWETSEGIIGLCATNGHRLATLTIPAMVLDMSEMVVSPKALRAVQRVFDSGAELRIIRGENRLAFHARGHRVVTRLREGPYPNWRAIVPSDTPTRAVFNTRALQRVIERALLITPKETRRLVLFVGETSRGEVWMSTRQETVGAYGERMELPEAIEGPPITIGLNGGYLLEVLKRIPTEQVALGFITPERAVTVQPVGEGAPDLRMLVMPLRLLDEKAELPWAIGERMAAA